MCTLRYLNESGCLHTLRQRYAGSLTYTYAGNKLVAIRPKDKLGIYTEKVCIYIYKVTLLKFPIDPNSFGFQNLGTNRNCPGKSLNLKMPKVRRPFNCDISLFTCVAISHKILLPKHCRSKFESPQVSQQVQITDASQCQDLLYKNVTS